MKTGLYGVIALTAVLIWAAGCQESDSQLVRRAKLVGSENIRLQKQLDSKEQEIEALQGQIAELKQAAQKQQSETSAAMMALGDILAKTTRDLEDCKAENKQLKESSGQPSATE